MKIRDIIHEIKRRVKGNFAVAKERGLVAETGVTVMGGVNFGSEPYLITLRRNCRISGNVRFITHDGGTWAFRNSWPEYSDIVKYGRIEVGEYTFVGAESIIMPGVKIGRNCVIGAGSIVTKDVPDESVVCGVPARKVCTILEYAEKCRKEMILDFDKTDYEKDKKDYLTRVVK